MNEKLLKDFIATAQKNNYNWNTVFDKFPELENYDKQLLKDYVATAEKNNYNYEVVNSKFPEFGFKKKSQAENGGSTLGSGSSVSPKTDGDYTYGDNKSMYRKQGENWLINNESTGGQYVDLKDPTGSRAKELNRNARKMSSLDIKSEQASKEISKTKDLSNVAEADSEIFTGYPGKEKNKYEFRGENWYEPNPEVEKIIQRETEKRKSLVGTAYEKTIAINIKNAIKDIPKTRAIKDEARIKALNKQFGKNAVAPIPSEVPLEKAQKTDQDYFTGAFGDVLRGFDNIVPLGFGDFIDDTARDVASGYRQGESNEESFNIGFKGPKASYKEIQQFIDAKKNSEQLAPSAEMQDYQRIYEEEGKGFWGVVKGLANNPSVIPSVLVSSITGMATNSDAIKAGAAAVGTGATYGAATGATAGGVGAIPGAAAGAVAAVPYAFGLASSVVEMGATFGELLTEELKGKELTKENVKAILEDPKKLQSIRNKAIARGVIIGAADALTGKLASGVGAKIISKSAAKSATGAVTKGAVVKSTAVGAAIEAAGGSAGEATARGAIGQDMDVSEISLEGLAELPGGIRSTIQARLAKPSYKVNGAKATSEQVDELINTMTPDDLAKTKIEIKNDYEGREFKIQDKIVTNSIKEQVKQGNPELNEPSLNAITQLEKDLRGLEGNTTQTGKDKAAAIRTQIKNIQENQLQEEATAETITAETPEVTQKRTERIAELETTLSQSKNNKGTITIDDKIIPRTELENELETLKIEQNAIQEQTTGQVPVQPTTAVGEEVVQGEPTAESQGLTEEGKAEEIKKALENLDDKSWSEISRLKEPNLTKAINEIEALNLPFEEHNKRITEVYQQYKEEAGASVEEAYHKAKKDGSNPELVKAVEELLTPTTQEVAPQTLLEELQLLAEEQAKAPTLEAPVIEAPVVEAEATSQEKVATYRAEEQAELLKAIPKIESYKVKGKIDKTKMPRTVLAKYNKIYEKYNALISPLLEPVVKAKAPVVKAKAPKAPVVKAPIVKAEAPKAKGELPVLSWSNVEEYDDAVIRSMKEIQYGKLKPLRALGKRTTVAQKEEIRTIEAKIATAERILDRRANKIKKEAQRVEKEGKGATVRAVDNNGTEAEYSVVVSKDGATAKVQLKKIGTLTPKRASVEANLEIETDEKRGRFVITKNKTKVYIDEAITPAKVEPTKAKVIPATTSVKALFESNPELANEVYEALGIKDNVVTKTNKKIDFDKLDKKWSNKILTILKEKYPEVSFEFTENTIQFIDDPMVFMQLSNKMYTEFKRLLTKKRPDLVDRGLIEKSLDDISAFSDEFGTKENKTKLEKLALHWMLNGAVILPEDGPKVVEAEKIASKKKLDAFSYNNPNEIIEKFAEESKKERVDPDTLSSFTNKKEIGDGIVIYDVDNSDLGQEQARIVLDTHFGEKSNPWCLLYKDADGSLTRAKEHWFGTYPGPKKIAFQNGKLIGFYGGGLWWDRLDNSSDGIPIVRKIKDDSLKRKQLIIVDSKDANKIIDYGNKTLGNQQNGEYKEWDKNDNLKTEVNYKDGNKDGKQIDYYDNGQIKSEYNYKDGNKDGKEIGYYKNGQIKSEYNYKDGNRDGKTIVYYNNGQIQFEYNHKDGNIDGKEIRYYENGQIQSEYNYKDGNIDGKQIVYYDNGQIKYEYNYKDGNKDGKEIRYYYNGQIKSEYNYKDGNKDGKEIGYYDNGQIQSEYNYKDGNRDGKTIVYYNNGQIQFEYNHKDGKLDGKQIDYYDNGQIQSEYNYKDGKLDGKQIDYYDNGQIQAEANYKDGNIDGKEIGYYKNGQIMSEQNYQQRNKEDEIIGQANTEAMTVLVNALKQKKDTIPHEYAHIYIAMFRDTPIVQEGIKRFGSEEKLVQAIGEQVVQQKGEAYNWWKKFTNFILNIMSDQQVIQVLTDSFLERADLTTYNYTKYSKTQAQNLFSEYIKQNPSGDIDGFREFVFEKQTKPVVKAEAKTPVKEEAPAPAKESTEDLMGAINSIKEDIEVTTTEIEDTRKVAREKINKIREEILDLKESKGKEGTIMDLEADIKEIEDILEDDLDGLKLDLDRHVQALKEEVKKLEDLDAKAPENKNTLLSYLDAAIKTLNGLNKLSYVKLDLGVSLATLKLILKGIRAGVIAGNTINASIKAMASQYRGKHKNKKITITEFTKEIEEYLRNTFVDQKTNEQDIQEARDKFVEIREAVRKAKVAVKTESKALRTNAENAIREMLKGKVKNLTAVQMKSIMLRLARFNVFSQTQYDKFIGYVDKVIGIADYDAKVNEANKNRKTAKKNTIGNKPKLGDITPDLFRSLSIMLNIDAKLIPSDVFESYYKIVDMLSKRDTVLQLEQRSFLNENVDKIIASIELNDEKISDLKELYDNFEKVKEDGKVDYSGTLAKMLKDDVINQDEYELMKTFKSKIVEAKVKDKMTEQEIADEKAELIDEVNNTTITLDEIVGDEFRLERELVKRLQVLLKQTDLKNLNNKDLKKLLIIIDNINNGFVSNATQLMVEKLNSTKKSIPLATSVHAKITSLYNKMNRFISKTFSRDEFGIAVAPLNLIDEQFGDFQTKNIYNSVFKDSAKAQQAFEAEISKIRAELTEIEKSLDKFFDKDHNKKVASKIKMMIYMLQIEKNSNPNSNKVHNAIDILDATIKFSKENSKKSKNSKADLKVLESIRENFVKDEQIDMDELFNSFGAQEKNALKKLQEINNSMTKKAAYTATVINGNKITTFDNYIFHNTISASDDMSVDALVNNISDNMQPTTKSKNLEERGDKALAMNLNPFLAVTVSSRSVLLNYHLTEPIRTARKTLIDTIKLLDAEKANGEKNKMTSEERKDFEAATKEQYDILNAIKDAYETATKDLLTSNFTESKQLIDWLSRQGYRAVLASAPRAVAELTSNALFVLSAFPKEITIGFNDTFSLSNSSDAKNILESLGSSLISRLYSEDSLSSVWLDTSAFANRISRDGKMKPKMVNGVLKFHDKYTGRWVDAVSFMADNLIAKPDQAIMRPLWFGSFVNSFKNKTGVEPDFNKIKENDEAYMDEYRDALEEARDVADNNADLTGGNMNPYMSSLQNVIRKEDSFPKVWLKTFQKYMNKFTVKEYYTARKGVRALVGDGDITQKQGALILTGVALRMTMYTTVTRLLSDLIMYSFGFGDDDGEDDDDYNAKYIGRKLYQGFTSMLTTLILGRRFGNVVRMAENYFIEWANEIYGEDIGLRNGEYDPYEDAVQFNQLQDGKIDKTTDLVKVVAGPYAPVIGTLDLLKKKTMELRAPEAKTERARITRAKEWGRLGLETTGFLGIMPLYKDVRKVFMGYTYKELKKETKETAVKKKAEEIKTALTDSQKISSLRKMRSSGRYTDKEINKAIRIIKDPEYKKAFNDKEEAIKKKILDKYGYDNKEDFERNDEKNYKIEFGKRSNYFQERAESAKIANELEKRVNALKDGVEYAPIKKTRKSSRSSYTGNSGYTGNSYTN